MHTPSSGLPSDVGTAEIRPSDTHMDGFRSQKMFLHPQEENSIPSTVCTISEHVWRPRHTGRNDNEQVPRRREAVGGCRAMLNGTS